MAIWKAQALADIRTHQDKLSTMEVSIIDSHFLERLYKRNQGISALEMH